MGPKMASKRSRRDNVSKIKLTPAVAAALRALGAQGGRTRAKNMTAAERSESARKAIKARWAKARKG